jgi:hypothetical protein
MTARRLSDNEFRKNVAMRKTKDESRLGGLKIARQFLSKRKAEEENPEAKKSLMQKISQIDIDISRLTGKVKKTPPPPPKINPEKPAPGGKLKTNILG